MTTWNALVRDREAEACDRWAGCGCAAVSGAGEGRAGPVADGGGGTRKGGGGKGVQSPSNYISRATSYTLSAYPGWGQRPPPRGRDAGRVPLSGPARLGAQALCRASVWCADTARAYLEAVTGPVASVTIVRTVHREPIVDTGEPEPLSMPIQVSGPFHVIDVDEAWTFAGHDASAGCCTTASGWSCLWPWRAGSRWLCGVQTKHQCSLETRHERARHRTIEPGA